MRRFTDPRSEVVELGENASVAITPPNYPLGYNGRSSYMGHFGPAFPRDDIRLMTALIFLEEYERDLAAERNGEEYQWISHEEGAIELLRRIDEIVTENDRVRLDAERQAEVVYKHGKDQEREGHRHDHDGQLAASEGHEDGEGFVVKRRSTHAAASADSPASSG